jgi:diaminopimelate decarboxylase
MNNNRSNLATAEISDTFRNALSGGYVREEDTALIFYDLAFLEERIHRLLSLFPPATMHALAIKANPLLNVLEFTRDINARVGVEAASLGEVRLALHAGYESGRIVYDSPVKTQPEIEEALNFGVHLNADNFTELGRIADILKSRASMSTIGIRINPQVGVGSIAESSVAGEYSKFGVPLKQSRQELLDAFIRYPWLTGVHLHVGSQGCSPEMLAEGAGRLYDLVMEINEKRVAAGLRSVTLFDIGGGMPVSYSNDLTPVSMESYVAALEERMPLLFRKDPSKSAARQPVIITEFGRWVYTNPGWTISRVEYVKNDPGISTAMIHVGADLFVRECLNPSDWKHQYSVLDSRGRIKTGTSKAPWNLAGPLCFSGDILAKNVALPPVEEGDYIVIHDTGGYTFSMWSRYNSRFTPRILGYKGGSFEILKERETPEDLIRFWG